MYVPGALVVHEGDTDVGGRMEKLKLTRRASRVRPSAWGAYDSAHASDGSNSQCSLRAASDPLTGSEAFRTT